TALAAGGLVIRAELEVIIESEGRVAEESRLGARYGEGMDDLGARGGQLSSLREHQDGIVVPALSAEGAAELEQRLRIVGLRAQDGFEHLLGTPGVIGPKCCQSQIVQ